MSSLVQWTVELVGPKGYIHGWIKVGMQVEHKDGSKGVVTRYDPHTQTAHIDFKSGPRVGKANKTTTKAYHLKQGAGLGPGHAEKPAPTPKPSPKGANLNEYEPKRGTLIQTEGQELADQLTQRPDLINGQAMRSLKLADAEMTKRSRAGDTSYDLDTHARVRVAMAKRQRERDQDDQADLNEKLERERKALPVKNTKAVTDERLSERRKVLDARNKAGGSDGLNYQESYELEAIKDEQRTRRAVKRGGPIVSGTATPAEGAKYRDTISKIIKEGPTKAPPIAKLNITSAVPYTDSAGNYQTSGTAIASMSSATHVMNVRPELHNPEVTARHRQHEIDGWFTRAEKATTSAHAQMTHEYGHHLDQTMSPGVRSSMLHALGNNLGFDHPIGSTKNQFTAAEKANIVNKVGTYAATNKSELIAELYKASRLGKNPSKAAQIVGEFMDQYHGGTK